MKKFLLTLAALALLVSPVAAQNYDPQELVPRWQHSLLNPSISVDYYVQQDEYHTNAFNGLAYMFAFTWVDRNDVNFLGLGLVNMLRMSTESEFFSWTVGGNVNFAGNFGIGVGWVAVDTANQRGFAIGKGRGKPDSFWFSMHLPLNGGGLINGWRQ